MRTALAFALLLAGCGDTGRASLAALPPATPELPVGMRVGTPILVSGAGLITGTANGCTLNGREQVPVCLAPPCTVWPPLLNTWVWSDDPNCWGLANIEAAEGLRP